MLLLLLQDAFATLVVTDLQGAPIHIPFELEPSSAAEKLRYEVGSIDLNLNCIDCFWYLTWHPIRQSPAA
jgi:hypothetical protein